MTIRDEDFDSPPQINIVPMIDVIFAILTFFIMATLFLTRSEGLPVNLPNAETSTQTNTKQKRVTVTIDDQGKLFLDRKAVTAQDLKTAIQSAKGKQNKVLVVINADRTVDHGQVIEVMDQVRTIEGATLGIATQRSKS
ncbi:MAG: biopolymer transporter ExbD [Drouetiella hepatica Uher 2000/2452]|jgi:biopolymer transport protein ExbD|uniref:Biopolymer transporter ExbD n=1 Tax=Drouetiella hepatica Uher 2000/2452 TaxID=904376 RepID=A0A951ULS8_9CYAN|nr:biopolymer transporter ExbD [Drouetiella hepatica Uher 2000/2452]